MLRFTAVVVHSLHHIKVSQNVMEMEIFFLEWELMSVDGPWQGHASCL